MGALEKALQNYVVGSTRGWALIRYSGTYDLQRLLDTIRSWLLDRKYTLADKEHTEIVKAAGKDIKVDTLAFRDVSDYVKFIIQVEIVILRNIDVMVEENGEKVKKQQGDMDVRVKAFIDKNYKKTFKPGFQEFLRIIYEKFIARRILRNYKIKLSNETQSLIDEIKGVLGLTK